MSQKASHAKHAVKAPPKQPKSSTSRELNALVSNLLIRVIAAVVIFIAALIIKTPVVLRYVLLILAAVAAGYDVFLAAINAVEEKDYFATPLMIVVITALSFVIRYPIEGAALVILYQIGTLALQYAVKRTQQSAMELVKGQDTEIIGRMAEVMQDKNASATKLEKSVHSSASFVLKFALIFALVYAIVLPLVSGFTFRTSLHRALMIALVTTPTSVVAAIPLTAIVGLCFGAQKGIVFHNAAGMEKAAQTNVVAFDKAGIFSANCPQVLSVQSDVLEPDNFMNFAAHAVYYSEQPIAKAVSAIYDKEYKLDVISDFTEIPGSGVALKIGGTPVVLATGEFLASRGVNVPQDSAEDGQAFYMTIAGRYIGKIVISADVNKGTADLAPSLNGIGIERTILLTEDSAEESKRIANELDFNEVHGEFDPAGKLAFVKELSESAKNHVMYVYANGIEAHSDADVDVRVSKRAKYADAIALPENVSNLAAAIQISRRVQSVASQNAIFAFAVKALLIFLSIIGYSTIWFVALIDVIAAIATVLGAFRVTTPPRSRADDEDEDDE